MNCRQYDIAMIVKGSTEMNLGRIVHCLEFFPEGSQYVLPDGKHCRLYGGNYWRIDKLLAVRETSQNKVYAMRLVKDEYLFPLRYLDGEDQMVLIAGLPGKGKKA